MTKITKKDIEGMIKRLCRSFPHLTKIQYEINTVYGVCNLDVTVTTSSGLAQDSIKRITIKSSNKETIYNHLHFVCEMLEFHNEVVNLIIANARRG